MILYNEPNHAQEWGGTIDPEDYADTLVTLAKALKAASPDFFILPAGLDASAESDSSSMDEKDYLTRMIAARPEILTLIDGWTSHRIPTPVFPVLPTREVAARFPHLTGNCRCCNRSGLKKRFPYLSPKRAGSAAH